MNPWPNRIEPTLLGVFVTDTSADRPVTRLPVYAEVIWTEPPPPPVPDNRFAELLTRPLSEADPECSDSATCRTRVRAALALALGAAFAKSARDRLLTDGPIAVTFLRRVMDAAIAANEGLSLDQLGDVELQATLDAAVQAAAPTMGLPVIDPDTAAASRGISSFPLGVLATDHVGYVSFDLSRLPKPVRTALSIAIETLGNSGAGALLDTRIVVHPYGSAATYEALGQRRFTDGAIVMRLALESPALPLEVANLGILALQNPSLADWRLSPGSFATHPTTLIGADNCETIVPGNFAVHEYYFHQVIGFAPREVVLPLDDSAQGHVRPGFINEYRLSLVPIGHSLGQILYSFPLAPGESVNFAVIDWTRQDVGSRDEKTKVNEQLVHDLRRDRVIGETVKASIEEWQRGGSLMGGVAGSGGSAAGASASQGGGSAGGAALGAISGVAGGISAALGGSYSTSSGSRDIAAETIQKLSENISQAATSARELFSTVVVQTSQAEQEAIETRTVVNYNHSHALTVLYYEVLRHFRLVVQFVRRRPALLTDRSEELVRLRKLGFGKPFFEVDRKVLIQNRSIIEPSLLDKRMASRFDVLESVLHRDRVRQLSGPPPPPPDPSIPAGPVFRYLEFRILSGGMVASPTVDDAVIHVRCTVKTNAAPWSLPLNGGNPLNPPGSFEQENAWNDFTAVMPNGALAWGLIDGFELWFTKTDEVDDMSFRHITLTGVDTAGQRTTLVDQPYLGGDLIMDLNAAVMLPANRPPPPPPPGRPPQEIDEEAQIQELCEHLIYHRGYYERALRLGTNAADRARQLGEFAVSNGRSLLELVENRPLEVLGEFVAYPCVDPEFSRAIMAAYARLELPDPAPVERLATFPTRGVFAEAKLGHCNASEEIDPTRFWDWQKSPIPHLAPEIAPTQPVTPQVVKIEGLGASNMPSPLVTVMNPPAAPDPHGMTAALTALATANIFRDMSGRSEVADLLKKLTDASVQIAGVAKDVAIGSKPSGSSAAQQQPQGSPPAQGGQPAAQRPAQGPGGSAPPTEASQPQAPVRAPTRQESERGDIDNARQRGEAALAVLPPSKRGPVLDKVAEDLTQSPVHWTISLASEWFGEGIQQVKMAGIFEGMIWFAAPTGSSIRDVLPQDEAAGPVWEFDDEGRPFSIEIRVHDMTSPFEPLYLDLPVPNAAKTDIIAGQTFRIPFRNTPKVPKGLSKKLNGIKADPANPIVSLAGTGRLAKHTITYKAKLRAQGEIGADIERELEGKATVEILEFLTKIVLKGAVKVEVEGEIEVQLTYDLIYIVGYDLKQA